MKYILDKADSRGHFNYDWLDTYQTFSFSEYYNPERMNFGALRVLNDDYIAPFRGFDTHPHKNMEIISIPIAGTMEHQDSMGNKFELSSGNIQIMSAGKGIFHSEFNRSDETINFLQIWILPKLTGIQPTYRNIITKTDDSDSFKKIISYKDNFEVSINQDAELYLGNLKAGATEKIGIEHATHGAYIFVIDGEVSVGELTLNARDGAGVYDTSLLEIKTIRDTRLLVMIVPMYQV